MPSDAAASLAEYARRGGVVSGTVWIFPERKVTTVVDVTGPQRSPVVDIHHNAGRSPKFANVRKWGLFPRILFKHRATGVFAALYLAGKLPKFISGDTRAFLRA